MHHSCSWSELGAACIACMRLDTFLLWPESHTPTNKAAAKLALICGHFSFPLGIRTMQYFITVPAEHVQHVECVGMAHVCLPHGELTLESSNITQPHHSRAWNPGYHCRHTSGRSLVVQALNTLHQVGSCLARLQSHQSTVLHCSSTQTQQTPREHISAKCI